MDEGDEPGEPAEEVREGGEEGCWAWKCVWKDVCWCHWPGRGNGKLSHSRLDALRLRPMFDGLLCSSLK
jgi:hypothetical protein